MSKKKKPTVDYTLLEQKLLCLAEPLVTKSGCELVDLEFVKEAGANYLRLYINRPRGVDHDCCETVSNLIGAMLDKEDLIRESYYLEVSSPGLTRVLRRDSEFERYLGYPVLVKLYTPLDGSREHRGKLLPPDEGAVRIEKETGPVSFAFESVAKVQLEYMD